MLCDGQALEDVIVSEDIWKFTASGSNHCEWQLLTKAAVGLGPSTGSAVMGMGKHSVGRFVLCPPLKREQWETTHAFSDVLEDLGHHPTLGVIDIFDAPEYLKVKPASM